MKEGIEQDTGVGEIGLARAVEVRSAMLTLSCVILISSWVILEGPLQSRVGLALRLGLQVLGLRLNPKVRNQKLRHYLQFSIDTPAPCCTLLDDHGNAISVSLPQLHDWLQTLKGESVY
jgi:hypothetical protein